jgi:hypothetical protein
MLSPTPNQPHPHNYPHLNYSTCPPSIFPPISNLKAEIKPSHPTAQRGVGRKEKPSRLIKRKEKEEKE